MNSSKSRFSFGYLCFRIQRSLRKRKKPNNQMTEIEIETYLYSSTSDDENEYSIVLITPNYDLSRNEDDDLNQFIHDNDNFSIVHGNKKKQSFSQFISRQNAANERKVKSQNQEPSERQFDTFNYEYVLKSSIPPPKDSQTKFQKKMAQYPPIYQRETSFKIKHPRKSHKENLDHTRITPSSIQVEGNSLNEIEYEFSDDILMDPVCTPNSSPNSKTKINSPSLMSEKSEYLANEKLFSMINQICGDQKTINRYNLEKTLRQFSIVDRSLISQFVFETEIQSRQSNSSGFSFMNDFSFDKMNGEYDHEAELLYDNQKLKNILINSILQKKNMNSSSFETQVKLCIFESLPRMYSSLKK